MKYTKTLDGLKSYGNSVEELKELLDGIPEGSKFDLDYTTGDRPWDSGHYTMTVTWEK